MHNLSGALLVGIGALHTVFGASVYRRSLAGIWRAGFFNAVAAETSRKHAFWFIFSGLLLIVLGQLCFWVERSLGRPLPPFVGWELLALGLLGAMLMPVSGFWLVIAAAIYAIAAA